MAKVYAQTPDLSASEAAKRRRRIVLGTFSLADASQDEFDKVLDEYFEHGGNWIDTAYVYGYGEAERKLGSYIRRRQMPIRISTKIGHFEHPSEYRRQGRIEEAFDASCERLGRRPDQLLLHEADWRVWWRDDAQTFQILSPDEFSENLPIADGLSKIRELANAFGLRWGFSGNNSAPLLETVLRAKPDVMMVAKQYDLLWRSAEPLVQAARSNACDPWLASPFHQGWLFKLDELQRFGAANNEAIADGARALERLLRTTNRGVVDLAIPYVLERHDDTHIVVGANRRGEISAILRSATTQLPHALVSEIDALGIAAPPMKSPHQRS